MTTGKKVLRVGMLAPMQPELQPIVRQLGMEGDGTVYRGRAGNVDVIAALTTMGMTQGEQAAERVLDMGVDWVMVVGIAGGVDRNITIGDVIVPEVVLDRRTGKTYRPTPIGDIAPREWCRSTWRPRRSPSSARPETFRGRCSAASATWRPTASSTRTCSP